MAQNNLQKTKEVRGLSIDLSPDYTQISYMCADFTEPKSVSTIPDESKYLIPTVMYKMHNVNQWYIGDEAEFRFSEDKDERYLVRNIIDRIYTHEPMYLEDAKYTENDLLQIYIETLLQWTSNLENIGRPEYIAVTVEKSDKDIVDAIYEVLGNMGYSQEKVSVLGHAESFIYYTLSQKADIWANDVVLFDFNAEHFSCRKLSVIRSRQPGIVTVKETDYSGDIDITYLNNERDKRIADERFLDIIRNSFHKQLISSVFLTGVGFYSDFAENSLVELCSKRRVFKGYNLFVKGACYAVMGKCNGKKFPDYIFQCEGRTTVTIGLMINHEGRNTAVAMSKAGTNWYEAGAKAECILDNTKSLQLVLSSPYDNCSKNVRIDLSDFPDRPNKTTRISISLAYVNEKQCDIVIEDLGFGDFFKATGMTVKETILIDNVML